MILYLGIVPEFFPWKAEPSINAKMQEKNVGIIFSYWAFKKEQNKIISKGLHDYFSYDGKIMVDSGAYSAFNSKIEIDRKEYGSFLSQLEIQDNDIIVNLDIIGSPKRSEKNWSYLTNLLNKNILPVIHIPNLKNNYISENYIGLGGLVPYLKINQGGSVNDVLKWIIWHYCAKSLKYHGFGIGSPFHQIIFEDFLYSIDWIGWRRNAAVCSCYTPKGSFYVNEARKKKKRSKIMTLDIFEQYAPPFLHSYDLLHKHGSEGWKYRALWNVWWFLIAKDHKKHINSSRYVQNLLKKKEFFFSNLKAFSVDNFF